MNPDELRQILEAAGRDTVPPPSAEFVDDLERRLARTHVVTGRGRLPRWPAISAVAAAAAVVVAVLVLQADDPSDTVVTDTSTSSTTTSSTTTTSTTTSTTVVASTTTVAVATTVVTTTTAPPPPATTTTVAPTTTTTTTAPPAVEDMRMACSTGPRPEVTCTWSASTAETFKGYILSKRVGDGPTEELGRTTDRSFTTKTDKEVQAGTRITYVIEAIDDDSKVVGRGEATVSCC